MLHNIHIIPLLVCFYAFTEFIHNDELSPSSIRNGYYLNIISATSLFFGIFKNGEDSFNFPYPYEFCLMNDIKYNLSMLQVCTWIFYLYLFYFCFVPCLYLYPHHPLFHRHCCVLGIPAIFFLMLFVIVLIIGHVDWFLKNSVIIKSGDHWITKEIKNSATKTNYNWQTKRGKHSIQSVGKSHLLKGGIHRNVVWYHRMIMYLSATKQYNDFNIIQQTVQSKCSMKYTLTGEKDKS